MVLFGSAYWQGFLNWLRETVLTEGKIAPADLDLLSITDSPQEVYDIIMKAMVAGETGKKEEAAREETRKVYESK